MRQNTKIDLGAYGKGIGTDEAIKMNQKRTKKSQEAMVALGGSIAVYGEKSRRLRLERRDPRSKRQRRRSSRRDQSQKRHKHFNIWRL